MKLLICMTLSLSAFCFSGLFAEEIQKPIQSAEQTSKPNARCECLNCACSVENDCGCCSNLGCLCSKENCTTVSCCGKNKRRNKPEN